MQRAGDQANPNGDLELLQPFATKLPEIALEIARVALLAKPNRRAHDFPNNGVFLAVDRHLCDFRHFVENAFDSCGVTKSLRLQLANALDVEDCSLSEAAAYYILRDEVPYAELGGDYFVRREDQERLTRRLVRQLERLGQRVTLEPAPEAR